MDYRSDKRKCQSYECFTSLSVSYFGYIMEVSSIGRGYWSTLRKPKKHVISTSMQSQVHSTMCRNQTYSFSCKFTIIICIS